MGCQLSALLTLLLFVFASGYSVLKQELGKECSPEVVDEARQFCHHAVSALRTSITETYLEECCTKWCTHWRLQNISCSLDLPDSECQNYDSECQQLIKDHELSNIIIKSKEYVDPLKSNRAAKSGNHTGHQYHIQKDNSTETHGHSRFNSSRLAKSAFVFEESETTVEIEYRNGNDPDNTGYNQDAGSTEDTAALEKKLQSLRNPGIPENGDGPADSDLVKNSENISRDTDTDITSRIDGGHSGNYTRFSRTFTQFSFPMNDFGVVAGKNGTLFDPHLMVGNSSNKSVISKNNSAVDGHSGTANLSSNGLFNVSSPDLLRKTANVSSNTSRELNSDSQRGRNEPNKQNAKTGTSNNDTRSSRFLDKNFSLEMENETSNLSIITSGVYNCSGLDCVHSKSNSSNETNSRHEYSNFTSVSLPDFEGRSYNVSNISKLKAKNDTEWLKSHFKNENVTRGRDAKILYEQETTSNQNSTNSKSNETLEVKLSDKNKTQNHIHRFFLLPFRNLSNDFEVGASNTTKSNATDVSETNATSKYVSESGLSSGHLVASLANYSSLLDTSSNFHNRSVLKLQNNTKARELDKWLLNNQSTIYVANISRENQGVPAPENILYVNESKPASSLSGNSNESQNGNATKDFNIIPTQNSSVSTKLGNTTNGDRLFDLTYYNYNRSHNLSIDLPNSTLNSSHFSKVSRKGYEYGNDSLLFHNKSSDLSNRNVSDNLERRDGRSLISPSTSYHIVQLNNEDIQDMLDSASNLITLLNTDCNVGAQRDIVSVLMRIVGKICSSADEACTSRRTGRQNDGSFLSSWLPKTSGTNQSSLLGGNRSGIKASNSSKNSTLLGTNLLTNYMSSMESLLSTLNLKPGANRTGRMLITDVYNYSTDSRERNSLEHENGTRNTSNVNRKSQQSVEKEIETSLSNSSFTRQNKSQLDREGRAISSNSYLVQLDAEDIEEMLSSSSNLLRLLSTECTGDSQHDITSSLIRIINKICSSEACATKRLARQTDWTNWLNTLMFTTQPTTGSPSTIIVSSPSAIGNNAALNTVIPGLESLFPTNVTNIQSFLPRPDTLNIVSAVSNVSSFNLTSPSRLAGIVNAMENELRTVPGQNKAGPSTNTPRTTTSNDLDFIYSRGSHVLCLNCVLVFSFLMLSL